MDYRKLALAATNALELTDDLELLQSLGKLVAEQSAHIGGIEDAASLLAFIQQLKLAVASDPVKTAAEKAELNAEYARLQELLQKLVNLAGAIPEEYRRLLQSVGSFDAADTDTGLVGWNILDQGAGLPPQDRYSLNVNGKLGVEFEAGDVWPFSKDEVDTRLLRIGAQGSLGAGAKATLPFQFGKFGASGEASGAVKLDYYFDVEERGLPFALAAAQSIPKLPDPFDFDAMWSALTTTDLAAVVYRINGAAALTVEVSFAESVELMKLISAELGATVSVAVAVQSDHTLSFRAVSEPGRTSRSVVATLGQVEGGSRGISGSLGLTLDLSQLGARIHQMLEKATEKWDGILDEIRPFLKPGTLLRNAASRELGDAVTAIFGDDALANAILRDLRGMMGLDANDRAAVGEWVEQQIAAGIDRASSVLTKEADKGADLVLVALGDNLPAFAEARITAALKPHLINLIALARAELEKTVENGFPDKKAALGEALHKVGATSSKVVNKADDALAGVGILLDRYSAIFAKILKAAEEAAKAKLVARLTFEDKQAKSVDYRFRGTFTGNGPVARDIFEALVEGRLTRLLPLFESDYAPLDFALDRARSSIERMVRREHKTGFEIIFLEFGVEGSLLLTTETDVRVDGNGRVKVDSRANLERYFKGLDETRKVTFFDAYALALSGAGSGGAPDSIRSLELGAGIVTQDKSLTRDELAKFVGSLTASNLLPQDALQRSDEQLRTWLGDGSARSLVGDVAVKLWLGGDAAARLLRLNERVNGRLTRSAALEILRTGIRALTLSGAVPRERLAQAASLAIADFEPRVETLPLEEAVFLFEDRWRKRDRIYSGNSQAQRDDDLVDYFKDEQKKLNGLVTLIQKAGDIYLARPAVDGVADSKAWDEKAYNRAQDALSEAVEPWFLINRKLILWVRSAAHPRTVALLRTISDLAGFPGVAPLSLVLTNRTPGKPAETVAIL